MRYALTALALGLNLFSVNRIHEDYYSALGGYGWIASLLLLFVAFIGYRPAVATRGVSADAGVQEIEDRTDFHFSRKVEIAIVVGIFLLALGLRFYRLDDWTTGMHGDEGEVGMEALKILTGNHVSPFLAGWFQQSNFYYWSLALMMQVFGTGMLGLRMFSALTGSLMVLPLYGLVRQWFGVRAAILAGVFLAISDVAIHFSRQEFSNITTPFFLCLGFYFLFRGLRNGRMLEFIVAGYAFMFNLYFYLGGRLTPFILIGVFGYLFLLCPC